MSCNIVCLKHDKNPYGVRLVTMRLNETISTTFLNRLNYFNTSRVTCTESGACSIVRTGNTETRGTPSL